MPEEFSNTGIEIDVVSRIAYLTEQYKRLALAVAQIQIPEPIPVPDLTDVIREGDRRLSDSRRPQRHGEIAHAGYIGDERDMKFDTNNGHDHDGTYSKQIDHGGLAGLTDDDHTIYALADKSRPAAWVAAADLAARSIADLGTKNHALLDDIGSNTHAQIDSKLGYSLCLSIPYTNDPADTTIYFIANYIGLVTISGLLPVFIPFPGTITKIYGNFFQTAGSNEAASIGLYKNSIDYVEISPTLDHSAMITVFSKTDLALSVNAGDYLELAWITPTWVTNPTTVMLSSQIWIET